jgi:phospholipid-binding lipoprotein MlaA
MRVLACLPPLALLAACATTPGTDRLAQKDPLEGFNRAMWSFNQGADRFLMKPIANTYRFTTPKPARRGISRLFANFEEPLSAVNNVLQGKPKRAVRNLGRFAINSTIGVGGLADHATELGVRPAVEDFGQTLAVWGVNGGPYLMLPLLGPSTMRDAVGSGIAQFADPAYACLHYCTNLSRTFRLGVTGGQIVSARADATDSGADALIDTSLDSYATIKSAYLQRHRAQILDQDDGGSGALSPTGAGGGDDAALDAAVAELKSNAGDEATQAPPAAPDAATPPPPETKPAETPADAPKTP